MSDTEDAPSTELPTEPRPGFDALPGALRPLTGRPGLVVAVLLVAGAVLALATGVYRWQTALPGDAALRADGQVVTIAQLDQRLGVIKALYGVSEPTKAADRREFRRDTAKSMALNIVLAGAASEADIKVSERQVNEQLSTLITSGYGGDRSAFVASLADNGVSQQQVETEMRAQLRSLFLFQKVTKPAKKPTDAEAKKFYQDNRAEMVTPELRAINNAVVASKAEAERALDAVAAGTPFASVVEQYSLDDATRDSGGSLGERARAELDPAYAAAAFGLKEPGFFGPVKTANGWNVGEVTKITPSKPVAYADISEEVAAKLLGDRQLVLWASFMKKQIDEAEVEYADAYRPSDPNALPVEDLLPPGANEEN